MHLQISEGIFEPVWELEVSELEFVKKKIKKIRVQYLWCENIFNEFFWNKSKRLKNVRNERYGRIGTEFQYVAI